MRSSTDRWSYIYHWTNHWLQPTPLSTPNQNPFDFLTQYKFTPYKNASSPVSFPHVKCISMLLSQSHRQMQQENVLIVYVCKSRLRRMSYDATSYTLPPCVYFTLVPTLQQRAGKFPGISIMHAKFVKLGSMMCNNIKFHSILHGKAHK